MHSAQEQYLPVEDHHHNDNDDGDDEEGQSNS